MRNNISKKPYFFTDFIFIYLFLERRGGKEKEREQNSNVWLAYAHPLLGTWPTTQACALTENWTVNPLVRRPALNPLSHTSYGEPDILKPLSFKILVRTNIFKSDLHWFCCIIFPLKAVIDANIFPILIEILQKAEFRTRKEAAWAITNATSGGTPEQIRCDTDFKKILL